MSNPAAEPASRIQRILAFMVAGLVIISIVCFAIAMIGYATGAVSGEVDGFWQTVVMLPYFALPAAFVLTITLLVLTAVRRSRSNRAG
ncbi:MAG: hypothetical protein IR160_05000 [Salinibacterium sp.]|nr:hypothetical protein [Salinibacterium sp.]MBF0671926.1 hypothetical protein [Salinibacterium sp.]